MTHTKPYMKGSIAAAGVLLLAAAAMAQQSELSVPPANDWCGTVLTPEVMAAQQARAGSGDVGSPRGSADYDYIRLAIHIVCHTNGTGAISTLDIANAIEVANDHFAPSRLVFTPMYTDYIYSDAFYTIDDDAEGDNLRQQNVVAGALNVYFVGDADYCGQSTFPGDLPQGVIMVNSCTGLQGVLAHEIGHYYDLLHTHETSHGAECPGSSNCASDGDLCCDTPPDPGLHTCADPTYSGACVTNCAYTGTAVCSNGLSYAPDVTNTMSYTDIDCMDGFSNDQHARIANAEGFSDRVDEIAVESACNYPIFVDSSSVVQAGSWANPAKSIRFGMALSNLACASQGGGVLIVKRGVYAGGTDVYSIPVTIVPTLDGSGPVEIRP